MIKLEKVEKQGLKTVFSEISRTWTTKGCLIRKLKTCLQHQPYCQKHLGAFVSLLIPASNLSKHMEMGHLTRESLMQMEMQMKF